MPKDFNLEELIEDVNIESIQDCHHPMADNGDSAN